MHGLASTNLLISLRFVLSKSLHSIPKCLSTDSAKRSVLSASGLVVLLVNFSVGEFLCVFDLRAIYFILHQGLVGSFSRLSCRIFPI